MRTILFMIFLLLFSTLSSFALIEYNNYEKVNAIIESIDTNISKDLIRAIAWVESYWTQYGPDGETFQHVNRNGSSDWGVMQVNDATMYKGWDLDKVKNSLQYNIRVGVRIFEWKLYEAPRIKKKYNIHDKTTLQVAIKMYNGWSTSWTYLDKVEKVLERKPWKKYLRRDEMFTMNKAGRPILYYIQHHSYSQDLDQTLDVFGIINYHVITKKWKRVGYNEITESYKDFPLTLIGRPIFMRGTHTLGMNHNSYGTCLIGNYDKEKPDSGLWNQQIERALVAITTFGISIDKIIGHWESFIILGKARTKKEAWKRFKTCPGIKFDMDEFRNDLYLAYNKYLKKG